MRQKAAGELADLLFPSEEDVHQAESMLDVPPEQRRLHTETYDFNVVTLVDFLKQGQIKLPDFQRRYVWTDAQASRLIESLIIQCPIPVVYLSQERDETLSVIDGNQRLTSLKRYLNNEFRLSGLTAYPELSGYHFFELDGRFQRHIRNRTIRCLVILKETHPQVKFDVFERLNTGSVRLSQQELRHGMYYGTLLVLADRLAKNREFARLVEVRDNKRMKLEELVVRFLAFQFALDDYRKPLAQFLNAFCEANRSMPEDRGELFQACFEKTVMMAKRLYGEHSFKIVDRDGRVISRFNAALFDAEMMAAAAIAGRDREPPSQQAVLDAVRGLYYDNPSFQKSVVQATSDEVQVRTRVSLLTKVLEAL